LGRRDTLLMYLFIDLGLRCGEIASLRVEGIDLNTGCITFYCEKVSLTQTHKLTPGAQIALMNYLPTLEKKGQLFPGRNGQKMTTRAINDRIRTLGERIGLENLSPHDLRHYWATHASRGGTDIKSLQDAGGGNRPRCLCATSSRQGSPMKASNFGRELQW
jgi:integrase